MIIIYLLFPCLQGDSTAASIFWGAGNRKGGERESEYMCVFFWSSIDMYNNDVGKKSAINL